MKVDTHVLLLPDTNKKLWEKCHATLVDEPINLLITEGICGHIGKARAKGFLLGNSPYISFVDPDDLVVPGAFSACIKTLEANPTACGTFTDEILIDTEDKPIRPGFFSGQPWNPLHMLEAQYMHHILVMKRDYVLKHLVELEKWPNLAEFIIKGLLTQYGPWIHTDLVGYKWRVAQTDKSTHKNFPVTGLNAARWRIIPLLYQAAQKYQAKMSSDKI